MKKITSGFWTNINETFNMADQKIIIDLSHERANHFGDQLFFISAFLNKDTQRFKFIVNKKYLTLWKRFQIPNVVTELSQIKFDEYIYLSTFENSRLNKDIATSFKQKIFFDFTDNSIKEPLFKHISNVLLLQSSNNDKINFSKNNNLLDVYTSNGHLMRSITTKKYYIYNDIIYSRGFLRKKLSIKLKKFIDSELGYTENIFFVGSKSDKQFTNFNTNLIDLRGTIDFDQLIDLFLNENCLGYIGLDNGLMHLSLLFNLQCKIIFRGKIFKSQTDHHFRCINIAMNKEAKNNIEYIIPK